MRLTRLHGDYAVARAGPGAPIPAQALSSPGFVSVTRTADELSLTAPTEAVSEMETVEPGWCVFKLHGPFAFDEVGVVSGLSAPLAEARIGIFVISTYDTDYILVKA
ncbi:MAG: ACT domain-containing protein, partial [Pseudomonadota bacterium]